MNKNYYLLCNYEKSEFDNELYQKDVGVDFIDTDGKLVEFFTNAKYIHPVDDEKALVEVKLIHMRNRAHLMDNIITISLPGADLLSGRFLFVVPNSLVRENLDE